jgi:CBS-domain-containing membrane protein
LFSTRLFSNTKHFLLRPFGALMTLQYGLTAAPASQPRNAIVGQTLGLLIAHGVGQIDILEPWLKQTLATSLAIGAMVKFGVTHPPAGAAALLFSNGSRTWQQIGLMIFGNVVAIVCAAIFNNLSERRQYPTFWGLRPIRDLVFGDKEDEEKKKK